MARGSYLTRRKDSQHWQLQLVFPKDFQFEFVGGSFFNWKKQFVKSLGTPDRAKAELLAAPYVHQFRLALYHWKNRDKDWLKKVKADLYYTLPLKTARRRKYEDGLQVIDGFQAVVQNERVTIFGLDGKAIRSFDNPIESTISAPFVSDEQTAKSISFIIPDVELPSPYAPPKPNADDALVEAYIRAKLQKPHLAAEARKVWTTYKDVVGLPLHKATRANGRKLVEHFIAQGNARATVQKKITWLSAAVNHAITEGNARVASNPFTKIMPLRKHGDEVSREPFTEEQMALLWKNLGALSTSDQLLWKLLAKTGMRLGEAMGIHAEQRERGTNIRFVQVGTKTKASKRGVPLPLNIGLPPHINGPLFLGSSAAASKRLNRFINDTLGESKALVLHSLRHRVADVLRHVLRPHPDVGRRLLGHAAPDVHGDYGKSPMTIFKELIDRNSIDGTI